MFFAKASELFGRRPAIQPRAAVRDVRANATTHARQDVADYYEAMTPAYLEGFGSIFQGSRPASTQELIDYIEDALNLAPGMRLLDAGCGVGGPALALAEKQRALTIDALTLSDLQAATARREAARAGVADRVTVAQGDFHLLAKSYPIESFDRVMFLESLCHAENYRDVIAGAYSVLKPGGGLYIKDFHVVDHRRDQARHEAQIGDLESLNRLYQLQLPYLSDLVDILSQVGFLIRFMRMPSYVPTFDQWLSYETIAGRHWAPKSGTPGEVIQAVEFFCWRA